MIIKSSHSRRDLGDRTTDCMGINVNVTLLSQETYADVAEAYLTGLETVR